MFSKIEREGRGRRKGGCEEENRDKYEKKEKKIKDNGDNNNKRRYKTNTRER